MAPNSETEMEVNPNNDLKAPTWINKELFQEILKQDIPQYSKIISFNPVAAIASGENYLSSLFRVLIDVQLTDGSTVHTSYILKTNVESEATRNVVETLNAFPKEQRIYEEILPKFEKLYAEAGKKIKFAPSCKFLKDTSDSNRKIVMEDLRPLKFTNQNRNEGLDMAHMTSVLKKIAEFHAASAAYTERFGPFSEDLCKSFYCEDGKQIFKSFGSGTDKMFIDILPKWGDCEKYIFHCGPNPDKLFDWFKKATTADPNEFNVLNHGDCWSNNCMFQHNSKGDVTETYFVDFQVTVFCPPAQDLHYFITSSAQYDLRIKEFDHFIKVYHDHLVENLRLLKYQKSIPSLKDIHIMMIKYSLWSFFNATSILTAVLAEGEAGNMDNLTGEGKECDDFKERLVMNPRYVKAMKQLLPWWENRGLFNFGHKNDFVTKLAEC